jgi:hydrogenase expression/formation protein HypC
MCLGIPGKITEIYEQGDLPMGKVEFGGIVKETCLAYTPEAKVGDYVIVHVGFAISQVDEAEAQEIFSYLEQIDQLEDRADVEPAAPADSSHEPQEEPP